MSPTEGLIITVTPNPAVDVTYRLPRARSGAVNRVESVVRRAGGKGINVACVLGQLGHLPQVTGFLGGQRGAALSTLLDASPVDQRWVPIAGETRCTTVVVDNESTTLFNEPGPVVTAEEWARLTDDLGGRCRTGDVVVLSGSFPPGTRTSDVSGFVTAVRSTGALILVDTSGPFLLIAADTGADLLKPNVEELLEATGCDDFIAGARALINRGAGAVAVSGGEDGLTVIVGRGADERIWRAAPPELVHGNPTGAGDAAVAALALALSEVARGASLRTILPEYLGRAVALSAAAVVSPVAGVVDLPSYKRFMNHTIVEEIHVPR
jgi:1-phosphofructokinase family hexose kinase